MKVNQLREKLNTALTLCYNHDICFINSEIIIHNEFTLFYICYNDSIFGFLSYLIGEVGEEKPFSF